MSTLTKRYIRGLGWLAQRDGAPVSLRPTGATTLALADRVVGTREAAAMVGVRPPNFVRDWASRSDFPSPIASLASGRVWSEAEVRAFCQRATQPSTERLATIAERVVWWQDAERTLASPATFVAHALAKGSLEDIQEVARAVGEAGLRRAVAEAQAGIFDERSWNFWLLVLEMDRDLPLPARRIE
jgi:predicted DNA-binding transcriptional regulator AlpA